MVFLRALYNHTRNCLRRYANNFLYPLGISFLLALLLLASTLLTRWEDLSALYALLMLGLTLIHCVLVFFIAIVLLLKKRILRSFSYVLLFLCDLIVNYIILFFITIAFMCSGPVKDHFIKDNDIKLPKDIELLVPKENTYAQDTKMPPFAEAIEEALINGPAIGNDEECHIPSLEKLMATDEGKLRLMHYLEASTEWVVLNNNVDGVYAERRKSRNGNSFNLFLEEDKPLVDFSFQIRLYFDKPARLFARNHKPYECIIEDYSTPNKFSARTWSQAGTASVYIVETATGRDGRKVDGNVSLKKSQNCWTRNSRKLAWTSLARTARRFRSNY